MRWVWLLLLVGCGKSESKTASPPPPQAEKLPFLEIADFEFKERMDLPPKVKAWHGKLVIVTGYINPTNQVRDLKTFLLVKDSGSCCYGTLPKFNHFIQVMLKEGKTVDYTRDPVSVSGVLEVGEVWDGDWLERIFTIRDAVRVE